MAKYDDNSTDDTTEQPPKPAVPVTVEVLANVVRSHQMARGLIPQGMPMKPQDAARWWVDHQEAQLPHERPREIKTAGPKGKSTWQCPYTERLAATFRKFLKLPSHAQRLILAAWEDGIPWRGEGTEDRYAAFGDLTMFEKVIEETEKFNTMGRTEYIDQVRVRYKRTSKQLATGGKKP